MTDMEEFTLGSLIFDNYNITLDHELNRIGFVYNPSENKRES